MKSKHRKIFVSGAAVATAGALGVGTLLQTVLSVQASSDMMPGIETIVSENTEDEPFRILELVDSSEDAEIGYYISGQEPNVKLYEYQYQDADGTIHKIHFSSVQDALSKLPEAQRREIMQSVSADNTSGIKSMQDVLGDDGPLSYTDYKEKYFLDSGDDASSWNQVELTDFDGQARIDTLQINGSYQENSSGTGDYTKEEQQYYPIRNGSDSDANHTGKYRENIQSFYPAQSSDSRGAYFLKFAEVPNSKVNSALTQENGKQSIILPEYDYANGRYGYFTNEYAPLTNEIVANIDAGTYEFPGEEPDESVIQGKEPVQNNEGDAVQNTITDSNEFSSGETGNNVADSEVVGDSEEQSSFDGNVDGASADVTFDNGFQSGDVDSSAGEAADTQSFDSDITLEQQSYEEPVDSSEAGGFSDDFSDQAVDAGGSSTDANIEIQEQDNAFDEESAELDSADESGASTDEPTDLTAERQPIGEITDAVAQGSQADPYIYLERSIAEFPYAKYDLVGDLKYVEEKAAQTEAKLSNDQNDPENQIAAGDILQENGQYWYYEADATNTLTRSALFIVTGRQPVSYSEIQALPSDFNYNYYYRVEKVYFCCDTVENSDADSNACVYHGWYSPSYPQNGERYLPVTEGDGKTATHYISEVVYSLTPGTGAYDFVPGGDTPCQVQVDCLYYQGGYINHDWFKKNVFHLTPKASADDVDGEFENFKIEVDTKSATDAATMVYAKAVTGEANVDSGADSNADAAGIEEAESADSASAESTQTEVDFTSEYQETEVQDAGAEITAESDETAEVSETAEENDAEIEAQPEEEASVDVGDGEAESTNTLTDDLKEYDLIYLNGKPAQAVAEAIINAGVPCIINAEKTAEDATFKDVFSTVINSIDVDGHYVSKNMYFYKNTDKTNTTGFVNKTFNTNFNKYTDSDRDLIYIETDPMSGFEEVIKYINSENRYRKLQADTDGSAADTVSDGDTDGVIQNVSLLSKAVSQARVIEYIINYKYKRTVLTKDKINVLEVMPDQSGHKLTEDEVRSWIDEEDRIAWIQPCCQDNDIDRNDGNRTFVATNLRDGDPDTFWHTQWQKDEAGRYHTAENPPYIDIIFKEPEDLKGFTYQARKYTNNPGHVNGVLQEYRVELYDENDTKFDSIEGKTGITDGQNQSQVKELSFGRIVSGVKRMRLVFTKTMATSEHKGDAVFGTCAELGIMYADDSEDNKLGVTIHAMTASEFVGHIDDLGAEYDLIYFDDSLSNRNTLITGNDPMLYTHVGGTVSVADALNKNDNFFTRFLGQMDSEYRLTESGTRYQDNEGRYYFAPVSTYSEDGAGYFRGSGNDLTDQKREELINFVKSGYPVILGSNLVSESGESRTVNKKTVDASSYYYQFIKEALGYSNVLTTSELKKKTADTTFLANLTKPQITFTEKPADPPRAGENVQSGQGWLTNSELKYVFSIQNDSDTAALSSTYDCKLYLDLNLDGVMSEQEAQDEYITVTNSNGKALIPDSDGRYQLKLKQTYTLTRKIPSDYYKLITWKLVVSNNNNTYIHTSVQGYTKQKNNGAPQVIKVLQIKPDADKGGTWDLKTNTTFQEYLKNVVDFDIQIETMTVSDYEKLEDVKAELAKYQVLIIGFADVYQDISNDRGQVDAIKDYIKSGKSVIFAHDTTSYSNYTYTKHPEKGKKTTIYPKIAASAYGTDEKYEVFYDNWMDGEDNGPYNPSWGNSFNTVLRSVIGMDRYGITSDAALSDGGQTISQLLKEGKPLDNTKVNYETLLKYAGDVAYVSGDESRSKSYAQTQALANGPLQKWGIGGSNGKTTKITKVNDGAITQYPYLMDNETEADGTLNISQTTCQYYQLALEQDYDSAGRSDGASDIVVWYCLSDKSSYSEYVKSPNDVRNYYYYYSKGNVIYCGSGHTNVENNLTETKLLINSIVAAANVTAVQPDVHFVKSLSPAAETETTRYYMTDQSSWASGEGNVLEKDMTYYINVRDYNMVSADLSQEDLARQEMTVQFYIDDAAGNSVEGCPSAGPVKDITSEIGTLTGYGNIGTVNVSEDGQFHLKQNSAYGLQISNIENYLRSQVGNGYKDSCRIYVKVTSTVSLYGQGYANSSWAAIDLKQRQLFELD